MLFVDLLRVTVLLIGGVGDGAGRGHGGRRQARTRDYATLIFAGGWWPVAAVLGLYLGSSPRAGEAMARALASARTATSLPTESPGRIAFLRLWPIGAFAIVVGGLAWLFPQVAAVGAGYAILNALAWRNRERAVTAIEERDGVRFYVEPTSALEPVKLIRTPGLGRDRMPAGHPPPPPPDAASLAEWDRPAWGRSPAWRAARAPRAREGRAGADRRDHPGGARQHQGGPRDRSLG